MDRNRWSPSVGTTGRHASEQVVAITRCARLYLHVAYRDYLEFSEPGVPGAGLLKVIGAVDSLSRAPEAAGVRVKQVFRHEGYKAVEPEVPATNDIALLELETSLPGPYARLSLSPDTDPADEVPRLAMVAGFGRTVPGKQSFTKFATARGGLGYAMSEKLLETIVPTGRRSSCKIADSHICAADSGRDTCSGDSGGPLVVFDRDKCPYQIGLTSYGVQACASKGSYGVYTRLSSHARWIREHVPNVATTGAPFDWRQNETSRPSAWSAVERLQSLASVLPMEKKVGLALCNPGDTSGCTPRTSHPLEWGEAYAIEASHLSGRRAVVLEVTLAGSVKQLFPKRARDEEADRMTGRTTVRTTNETANWDLDGGWIIALSVADDAVDLSHVAAASDLEGKVRDVTAYLAQIEAVARQPSTGIGILSPEVTVKPVKQ